MIDRYIGGSIDTRRMHNQLSNWKKAVADEVKSFASMNVLEWDDIMTKEEVLDRFANPEFREALGMLKQKNAELAADQCSQPS